MLLSQWSNKTKRPGFISNIDKMYRVSHVWVNISNESKGRAWYYPNMINQIHLVIITCEYLLFVWFKKYVIQLVPSMNQFNPFFSELVQPTHNMYEHAAIITQICHEAKCCFTSMNNAWYLITIPNMNNITTFFSEISQQRLKHIFFT